MTEVHCARCGAAGDPIALGWMSEHDPRRGRVWICQACAREHLRAIEAKLAQEWWQFAGGAGGVVSPGR